LCMMDHACNPNYSRGKDQDDDSSRLNWEEKVERFHFHK
jgi:hypothetical protein